MMDRWRTLNYSTLLWDPIYFQRAGVRLIPRRTTDRPVEIRGSNLIGVVTKICALLSNHYAAARGRRARPNQGDLYVSEVALIECLQCAEF